MYRIRPFLLLLQHLFYFLFFSSFFILCMLLFFRSFIVPLLLQIAAKSRCGHDHGLLIVCASGESMTEDQMRYFSFVLSFGVLVLPCLTPSAPLFILFFSNLFAFLSQPCSVRCFFCAAVTVESPQIAVVSMFVARLWSDAGKETLASSQDTKAKGQRSKNDRTTSGNCSTCTEFHVFSLALSPFSYFLFFFPFLLLPDLFLDLFCGKPRHTAKGRLRRIARGRDNTDQTR